MVFGLTYINKCGQVGWTNFIFEVAFLVRYWPPPMWGQNLARSPPWHYSTPSNCYLWVLGISRETGFDSNLFSFFFFDIYWQPWHIIWWETIIFGLPGTTCIYSSRGEKKMTLKCFPWNVSTAIDTEWCQQYNGLVLLKMHILSGIYLEPYFFVHIVHEGKSLQDYSSDTPGC